MRTCNSITLLVIIVIVAVLGYCEGGDLKKNFYRKNCPRAEKIIRLITLRHVSRNPALPAKLLRMHFHDCFVRGCDASILLNSTANSRAEKDATPNQFIAGFNVIDDVKAQLEKICPGVVSCADIIALATRDSVSFGFRRSLWEVQTGRRDGTVSLASDVLTNLAPPTSNFSSLEQNFANNGLSVLDLVVLSGAHTIGRGHCALFNDRLYNFTGKGDADPSLDPTYAKFLRTRCSPSASDFSTVEMDPQSSLSFDKKYYIDLKQNKGLFTSDAALLTNVESRNIVNMLLKRNKFFHFFSQSMKKLGAVKVLTGDEGEIRRTCSVVNS